MALISSFMIIRSRVSYSVVENLWNRSGIAHLPVTKNNLFNIVRKVSTFSPLQEIRKDYHEPKTSLTVQGYFHSEDKSKETFLAACDVFKNKGPHLRGHVEFIYAALKYMEDFGVHKDVEVYKKLLDLMPKGKMIPTNVFQVEFMHYPKQQQCAVDCLDMMEMNGVMPDTEVEQILKNTFGKHGHPVRKFGRMMYWMPKFKNASPWHLPNIVPNDAFELAKMAVSRMCTVDPTSTISIFETKDVDDAIEDTWIVSGQSPIQQELVEKHPADEPIKVEGPFRIFLRDKCVGYFILRAEARPPPLPVRRQDVDDVGSLKFWFTGEIDPGLSLTQPLSVHEQEDGVILAICATGTSGRDSLLSWIRMLEKTNPNLANIPVLFTQSSPIGEIITTKQQDEASVEAAS